MLKITKKGIIVIKAIILGRIRYPAELTPMISNAINLLGYTHGSYFGGNIRTYLPDRIKHMMEEENSSNMISRVV